ncbi:MAG: helix-turn-helix domain-containing protein [Pseudolabrys sp.]|nr:helix-turn-helix domain-containing protein [Pseudolabrys sp.]
MTQKPSETVVDAWIALVRAQQAAVLKVERAFREAGLPPHAWYDVLWELDRAPEEGLRPFDIERRMLIAQSNISRLIDRLEEKGYVERRACESDGRGQNVAITASGRTIRRRMWPIYAKAISETVGQHFSEREAATVRDLLTRLVDPQG